jgi:hypothetical protein
MTEQPRPGDQQLPVPNDGPSMHDLVIAELQNCPPESDPERSAIIALLAGRKRVGLERYDSILQANNGRDARRDLLEELADAVVYGRQIQEEDGHGRAPCATCRTYEHIMTALFWAQKIPETQR